MKTWYEDHIKLAAKAGFTPQNNDYLKFGNLCFIHKNGITHIWRILRGWQVAEYIDGRACNHRPHRTLERALKDLPKTLQGWIDSKKDLTNYLDVGDVVTEDLLDEIIGSLPPTTWYSNKYSSTNPAGCLQMGEPYSVIEGKTVYITFERTVYITKATDHWRYVGLKPKVVLK